MIYKIKSEAPEDTVRLGFDLGRSVTEPVTILLMGGMGAGKTQITHGIVKGIGIEDDVSSPTYTLVNEYSNTVKAVYHFDLYRIGSVDELYDMGFEDYLTEKSTLIIEWPQIAEDYPFDNPVVIKLEAVESDPFERVITIETEDAACIEKIKALGW